MMVDIKLFVVFTIFAAYFGAQLGVEAGATSCKCGGLPTCVAFKQTCDKPTNCFKLKKFRKGTPPDTIGEIMEGCQFDDKGTPGKCEPIDNENYTGNKCFCDVDNCTPPDPDGSDGRILRSSWCAALLFIFASSVIVVGPTFVGGQ